MSMDPRTLTYLYVQACMRKTFEDRVVVHGEYPVITPPPMPEGYKKALEAQRKAKEQHDAI